MVGSKGLSQQAAHGPRNAEMWQVAPAMICAWHRGWADTAKYSLHDRSAVRHTGGPRARHDFAHLERDVFLLSGLAHDLDLADHGLVVAVLEGHGNVVMLERLVALAGRELDLLLLTCDSRFRAQGEMCETQSVQCGPGKEETDTRRAAGTPFGSHRANPLPQHAGRAS